MILCLLLLGQLPTDYDAADARSRRDKVPLVVMVSAPDCGPCQRIKPLLKDWGERKDFAFVVLVVRKNRRRQEFIAGTGGQILVDGRPLVRLSRPTFLAFHPDAPDRMHTGIKERPDSPAMMTAADLMRVLGLK